jgi:hypothetical protein
MLGAIYKALYFKLPIWLLSRLLKKNTVNLLQIVSKDGHYKNRIYISENIDQLPVATQIKVLDILLEDPIQIVSINAIGYGKLLLQSKYIRQKAHQKERYWERRELELSDKQKRIAEILKGSTNYKRKFGDGASLKNVKQMLKRNLHGGKWF